MGPEVHSAMVAIHNVLRWVVVLAALAAIVGSWHGVFTRREWTSGDRLRTVAYVASMHVQLLLGIILYANSPIVRVAFEDPGAAMGERGIRFFFVEHIFLMIVAVVVVQLGSILAKRAEEPFKKHRRAAICFTLGLVLVFAGTPWFRPLFPGL